MLQCNAVLFDTVLFDTMLLGRLLPIHSLE